MNATALSPCVPCGLRQEVALVRLVPLYILTAPPRAAETIVPTLYDPEEFAALYHADKQRAIALIAAMTAPQRVRQALAYAAWLGSVRQHVIRLERAQVQAGASSAE